MNKEEIDKIIIDTKNNMLELRENGLYLSNNHIDILNRYNIDYRKFSSIDQLLFVIEDYLNNEECDEDLENVSEFLSEFKYYNYTNK